MTVKGVLTRFTIAYVVLLVGGATLLVALEFKPGSSLNTAVLLGSVLYACLAFGQKNGRYFTPEEKSRVVWGMIAVNLVIQTLIGSLVLLGPGKLSAGLFFGALAFVGALHAGVIYVFVGVAGKNFAKQLAKKQAKEKARLDKLAWADTKPAH